MLSLLVLRRQRLAMMGLLVIRANNLPSAQSNFSCNLFSALHEYTDAWIKGREMIKAGELESVHFAARKFGFLRHGSEASSH